MFDMLKLASAKSVQQTKAAMPLTIKTEILTRRITQGLFIRLEKTGYRNFRRIVWEAIRSQPKTTATSHRVSIFCAGMINKTMIDV